MRDVVIYIMTSLIGRCLHLPLSQINPLDCFGESYKIVVELMGVDNPPSPFVYKKDGCPQLRYVTGQYCHLRHLQAAGISTHIRESIFIPDTSEMFMDHYMNAARQWDTS